VVLGLFLLSALADEVFEEFEDSLVSDFPMVSLLLLKSLIFKKLLIIVLYLEDSLSFMKIVKTQIHSGKEVCSKFLLVIIEESDASLVLVDGVLLPPDAPGVVKVSLFSLPLDEANTDGL